MKGTLTLYDFADLPQQGVWRPVEDRSVVGVFQSPMRHDRRENCAIFDGSLSVDNECGFASIQSPDRSMDLRDFTGILLQVKGDGKVYRISFRTDGPSGGMLYHSRFITANDIWKAVEIPFKEFVPCHHDKSLADSPPLDLGKILSIGFMVADRQTGPFCLKIHTISAYL